MRYVICAAIAVICTTLGAQTMPPASPQFEVASVRPEANDETGNGRRAIFQSIGRTIRKPGEIPMTGTDRVSLQGWTLLDLVAAAYGVSTTQVSGPGWLADQNFDVEAKVLPGTAKQDLHAMLQSLLEERFSLKAHRDTHVGQGFALVVGKNGPNLKPADPPPPLVEGQTAEERNAQIEQRIRAQMEEARRNRGNQAVAGPPLNVAKWSSITMPDLASHLVKSAGAPVIDETGLKGKYAVRLETSIVMPGSPDIPGGTIFDAVEKLGLKLEPRKMTIETVVVDHVSKTPTAN